MEINKIHNMDCLAGLKLMEDKSVHCVVTSPPYWGLRDYGVKGQLGLEKTPKLFIKRMVAIFKEIKRVLRDDGTVWLNIGDSYCSTGPNSKGDKIHIKGIKNKTAEARANHRPSTPSGMKPKDLVGIPWMLAFALRADGWYLRQDIIWHKTTSMPESVTDRCTKNHEYIFLLTKKPQYYYDHIAIMKDIADSTANDARFYDENYEAPRPVRNGVNARPDRGNGLLRKSGNKERKASADRGCPAGTGSNVCSNVPWEGNKANKRSVWTVTPKPFAEAHFATYPQELIIDCILAGSSEYGCCDNCGAPYKRYIKKNLVPGPKASFNSKPDERDAQADAQDAGSNRIKDGHKPGWLPSCKCPNTIRVPAVILDPFMGAGTTALVAQKLGRNFIGFELNSAYVKMANKRLNSHLGMFSPENIKAISPQPIQLTIE